MRTFQLLPLLAGFTAALSPAGWRSQSIYQVVTDRFARTDGSTTALCDLGNYCGGTFQGLTSHLDYIQGMGFTAIWISPVTAQLTTMTPYGLPYHGYWPQDFYSINPKFGTAADLKVLSATLHKRGMYLMVDVVPNHVAWNGAPNTVDYSAMNPFNDQKYYHTPYCAIDYSNETSLEDCWIGDTTVSLPDLKVESAIVQNMFNKWVSEFVSNYSIDGLRIDSVLQMNKTFFPGFVSASGVYAVGEVVNGGPNGLCDYQNYMPGVLNYAYYFWVVRAFGSTSSTLSEMANNIPWLKSVCKDSTLMPTFMENHDQPRFASITGDTSLIQNAVAFTLLSDGIPLIYYGQEQGFSGSADPYNREAMWTSAYDPGTPLYKMISKLNFIRSTSISIDSKYSSATSFIAYSDSKTLVTLKGGSAARVLAVFTNDGATVRSRSITLLQAKTGFPANTKFTEILSCSILSTDAAGNLAITISNGLPMVLYNSAGLVGYSICSISSAVSTSNEAKSTPSTEIISKTNTSYTNTASKTSGISTGTSSAFITTTMSSTKTASSSSPVAATMSSTAAATATPLTANAVSCPASNMTTVSSYGRTYLVECGIDHFAGDMSMVYASTLAKCINACAGNSRCVGAALSGETCYMKSSIGTNVYNGVAGFRMCSSSTSSVVTFNLNATTTWGTSAYLIGSVSALGGWDTSLKVPLDASKYPIWSANVTLPAGTLVEYKFIKSTGSDAVWESDPNRNMTVPTVSTCGGGVGTVFYANWQT